MSLKLPDFDRADYLASTERVTASVHSLEASAWQQQQREDRSFLRSLLRGFVVAALSSAVYAAFTIVTHIVLGFAGIVVGAMIGGAMIHQTDRAGGRRYQVAAAILTYLSICSAATLQVLWALHRAGRDLFHLGHMAYQFLAMLSVASPFFRLTRGWTGLIDLLILLFSIQAAWRVAGGKRTNG